ncbi:MAG: 3-hydroxyisobutyrate dehydrogenase [Gammaproteobacteria bacterium]|nr:3-hydroxyisobutyrate dehydrogenase [Gammaproteobacteria bacterium]
MTTIGFIGLGHMGKPMVENLLQAGFKLIIYDVMPQSVAALVAQGAESANTLESLAKNSDIIITSVQTGEQVTQICLANDGIFAHAKQDLLYIDCSSIDITTTRNLHQEAHQRQIAMLDAPVSGGVAGAKAASLTFMVGGSVTDFQRAEPILKIMGKKIVHAGEAGNGQAAKICNNLLLGISMIGVCEAFNLAEKLGLAAKTFFEISSNASGQCWSMTRYCPVPDVIENVPANHAYQPGFMAKMMLKDLHLAQHAAEATHAYTPLGELTTELFAWFVKQGFGEMDFSGIMQLIADGISLAPNNTLLK